MEQSRAHRFGEIIFRGPLRALGYDVFTGSYGFPQPPFANFELDPAASVFSNTYTILRPPISDFGLIGSLLWWSLIGSLQGVAYRRGRQGRLGWLVRIVGVFIG